ncbi:MAG: Alpha-L-glutamate ligase, RimK family [Xanthobacteraceae bacterium]|nr:Alpha-L-glutamate ligase, RimK family [Xanthobacteraceae bacterium]
MPHSLEANAPLPTLPKLRIALVVDRVDWHARKLIEAFAKHRVRAVPVNLSSCGIATSTPFGLTIAGFGDALPDAVMVRSMAGGSFQAVTLRLGILHALRELGVPVWNDARAIERCVDKSMTSFVLARAGIATPETWAVEALDVAKAIVRRETPAGSLVFKPLFGSQGRGLRLIHGENDLPAPAEAAGVYYLQRYVGIERDGYRDFRLLVSQGRVVAAMVRHADQWITNVKQGGRPVFAVPDAEMKDLALRATAAIGANFAGVDIIHDAQGRATVIEVNSMPAWSGLQKVTPASIAAVLVRDLVEVLRAGTVREAQA